MELIQFAIYFTILICINILAIKIFMIVAKYIGEKLDFAKVLKSLWIKMGKKLISRVS